MKIIYGNDLIQAVRSLSEKATKRLWIAAPFIGSVTTTRKLLGREWYDSPNVSVRLLTDTNDLKGIDTETVQLFHERGEVKSLLGLHAKIYIVDNQCIVTSANLTNTAFAKRYEIGVLLNNMESIEAIKLFEIFWKKALNVELDLLHRIFKKKKTSSDEINNQRLKELWMLPDDPGSFIVNLQKRFLNYDRLLADYKDFSQKYASIQRLWPKKPLYLEVDGMLNYLYHDAPGTPSRIFAKRKPRLLTNAVQLAEIKKYALLYKKSQSENEEGDIHWRIRRSNFIKKMLSPKKIMSLSRSEIEEVLRCLNCLNSYPINRTKILSNNKLSSIKDAMNRLINDKDQLASRMDYCNQIRFMGTSSMNELIGFAFPDRYPLINKNSNCGLRLFGYQIKPYA